MIGPGVVEHVRERAVEAPRGLVLGADAIRALRREGAVSVLLPPCLAGRRRFWLREAFRLETLWDTLGAATLTATALRAAPVWFEADCGAPAETARSAYGQPFGRLRPAIVMPRWASRYVLARADDPEADGRFVLRIDARKGDRR